MYCSKCELEIKGDNKDECPICGSPLSENSYDDGALTGEIRPEYAAIQGMIADINNLGEQDEEPSVPAADSGDQAVFVLEDYEPDSATVAGEHVPAADAMEEAYPAEESVLQPDEPASEVDDASAALRMEASGDTDESLHAMLNSIKQSIAIDEPSGEANTSDGHESQEAGEDSDYSDTIVTEASNSALFDTSMNDSGDFLPGFEDDDVGESAPSRPARKRSPAFAIVLILLLLGVGGYFAFTQFPRAPVRKTQVQTVLLPTTPKAVDKQIPDEGRERDRIADVSVAAKEIPSIVQKAPQLATDVADAEDTVTTALIELQQPVPVQPLKAEAAPGTPERAEPESHVSQTPLEDSAPKAVASRSVEKPDRPIALVRAPFYTIHAGSYRQQATAASEVTRIKAKGHDAFVERVDLKGRGVWFRVKVGRFKTRAEAEAMQVQHQKDLVPGCRVVLNR